MGALLRPIVLMTAFIVFVWAGYIEPSARPAHYFATGNLLLGLALTAVLASQHAAQVARVLNPSSKRMASAEETIRGLAQTVLTDLVKGKRITDDRLGMFVHVWIVPLWYRQIAPYPLRKFLKWVATKKVFVRFASKGLRPGLVRLAAVGLVKRNSSHVTFVKGRGLIGICLSLNQEDAVLSIDLRDEVTRASLQMSANEWAGAGLDVTHGLSLSDARQLASRYGQVIVSVLQSPEGEALGCATISVPPGASVDIVNNPDFHEQLHKLAQLSTRALVF